MTLLPDAGASEFGKKSLDYESVILSRYDYSQCNETHPSLMTFEDFQNRARLYVIGALYPEELPEFESAKSQFGSRAQSFLHDCYALRDAFALSLRSPARQTALNQRVLAMTHAARTG